MTSNILNDKNWFASDVKNKIGDECAVVQRHLSVFLDEILETANRIICGDDSIAASNSSTELPQSKIKTETEWVHRIDHLAKSPLSFSAHQANSPGEAEEGRSDFRLVHERIPIALTLFEAVTPQLHLLDTSEADVKKAIAQGAYQMIEDVHRLTDVIKQVPSYSSLLTNGLVWIHLRRIEKLDGVVWLHSSPTSVVKEEGRGKTKANGMDNDGLDSVVDHILYALVTAKNRSKDIFEALAGNDNVGSLS